MNTLVTWVGRTDLLAARGEVEGIGPIAQAIKTDRFDSVVLLNNFGQSEIDNYLIWIEESTDAEIVVMDFSLSSPTAYAEIFRAARSALDTLIDEKGRNTELTFHLSPGTPAMSAIWLILAQMGYRASLIESSVQQGVTDVEIPFDLAAEFIPGRIAAADSALEDLSASLPPAESEFRDIVHRGALMRRIVGRAEKVAKRSIPVLIEGESGTGKELFARAIHAASPRAGNPFVAVNCGAIASELAESEFFGHKKGAFSGAISDRAGHFREADGGTLFLDEIGELPLAIQVKLLRVLQEGEVVPVGGSKSVSVNIRVIAATNRNLINEITAGRFREDLFYRIAVAVLKIPPLRERAGDLTAIMDSAVIGINYRLNTEPGWIDKKISVNARKIVLRHAWPGNVRELINTLTRAMVWAEAESVTAQDMKDAIMEAPSSAAKTDDIMQLDVNEGVDLQELITRLAQHYISDALEATGGNKTKAAGLVGLGSYQTLTNWMQKYNLEK